MADINKRLPGNVEGDFFVDSTCDNFDICRQLAPETFIEVDKSAVVGSQPQTDEEKRRALRAVVCCPKGSIGTVERSDIKEIFDDFPLLLEDDVFYCGFNTIKAAGGNAYFIKHSDGNWLICTPKYVPHLVSKFEQMGGIKYIFLSHRDDLGETDKYAQKFGSKVIIHKEDLECRPAAEVIIDGYEAREFAPGFLIIPTPGHTEGHTMLLYNNKFLFSGDSLSFNRQKQAIGIWDSLWTWYSWEEQACSVNRLADYSFQWILPSHGQRIKLAELTMKEQIRNAAKTALVTKELETPERLRNLEGYAETMRNWHQPVFASKIEQKARALKERLLALGKLTTEK